MESTNATTETCKHPAERGELKRPIVCLRLRSLEVPRRGPGDQRQSLGPHRLCRSGFERSAQVRELAEQVPVGPYVISRQLSLERIV